MDEVGQVGTHNGERRPGLTLCQDKGLPRAQPLTVHAFPQPQTPGLPFPPTTPEWGPGKSQNFPDSVTHGSPLHLTAGIRRKKWLQSSLQGSPRPSLCLRPPTGLPMGLSSRLGRPEWAFACLRV